MLTDIMGQLYYSDFLIFVLYLTTKGGHKYPYTFHAPLTL